MCLVGPPGVGKTSLGSLHRARARPQVRAPLSGRPARRGGDTRPPPHVRRRDAGPHRAGFAAGGHEQPAHHARRDRQGRRRFPRRPLFGAPRSPRPGAEQLFPRQLPRRHLRSVERDVHDDGERARHRPARAARPHGGHPPRRLHRGREAGDRAPPPAAEADRGERHRGEERANLEEGADLHHPAIHAGGGPPSARTRDRQGLPQGRAPHRRGALRDRARLAEEPARISWARPKSSPKRF